MKKGLQKSMEACDFKEILDTIIGNVKKLNDIIKKLFPWVDSGCNDCKHFKANGKWGEWGGKIRYGECLKSIEAKKLSYKGQEDRLDIVLLKGDKNVTRRDLVENKEVIAIPDYCVDMNCFEYRRPEKIPKWFNK